MITDTVFVVKNMEEMTFIDGLRSSAEDNKNLVRSLSHNFTARRFKEIFISFRIDDLNESQKEAYYLDLLTRLVPGGTITFMSLEDMAVKLATKKMPEFVTHEESAKYAAFVLSVLHLEPNKHVYNEIFLDTSLTFREYTTFVNRAVSEGYLETTPQNSPQPSWRKKPILTLTELEDVFEKLDLNLGQYVIEPVERLRGIGSADSATFVHVAYNCFVHNILWALQYADGDVSVRDLIKNDTCINNAEFDAYFKRAETDGFISETGTRGWNTVAPLTLDELSVLITFRDFPKYNYLLCEVIKNMNKSASDYAPPEVKTKTISFQDIDLYGWNIFNERYPTPVAPIPPRVLKMKVADMDINRWEKAREEIRLYQDALRVYRTKSAAIKEKRDTAFFELLMKRFDVWHHFWDHPARYNARDNKIIIQKMYNRAVVVSKHNRKKSPTNYTAIAVKFEEFMNIGVV